VTLDLVLCWVSLAARICLQLLGPVRSTRLLNKSRRIHSSASGFRGPGISNFGPLLLGSLALTHRRPVSAPFAASQTHQRLNGSCLRCKLVNCQVLEQGDNTGNRSRVIRSACCLCPSPLQPGELLAAVNSAPSKQCARKELKDCAILAVATYGWLV
jgi:hypothetical protein